MWNSYCHHPAISNASLTMHVLTKLQTHTSNIRCSLPLPQQHRTYQQEKCHFKFLFRLCNMSDFGGFNQIPSCNTSLLHSHRSVSARLWGSWEYIFALPLVKYFLPTCLFIDVSNSKVFMSTEIFHYSTKKRSENKTAEDSGIKYLCLAETECASKLISLACNTRNLVT